MEWTYFHLPALSIMLVGYALGALLPALLGVVWKRSRISRVTRSRVMKNLGFTLALLSSLAGCFLSLSILLSGTPLHVEMYQSRLFGPMAIHADGLSAFFLGIIALLATSVSVYSFGYATGFLERRNMGLLLFLYNAFLLSMVGVVIAGHAVLFLFVWEVMSLTTFFLINYEHEEPSSRRAAFLYVVMAHIGTALLVVMFMSL